VDNKIKASMRTHPLISSSRFPRKTFTRWYNYHLA